MLNAHDHSRPDGGFAMVRPFEGITCDPSKHHRERVVVRTDTGSSGRTSIGMNINIKRSAEFVYAAPPAAVTVLLVGHTQTRSALRSGLDRSLERRNPVHPVVD